ncbi:MAG TPA: cytochrome c [Terriglobia bacterium]|nr:cytochrome c [Terriglobia bacterium]
MGKRALIATFLTTAFVVLAAGAQNADEKIWGGVYTAAQAERGKAQFAISCERCHGADLGGAPATTSGAAPSLKGARFTNSWDNKTVYDLYTKIRDTMPPNFGTTLTDENKLDVVAFLLESNSYPAGSEELKIDSELLDGITFLRKGAPRPTNIPNFSVVQVVGCLAQGPGQTWVLNHSSAPAPSRDQPSTAAQLKAATSQPLGDETFRLVSVSRFKPDLHNGQKVEAKGLLYREGAENRINVTVMESVAPACAVQ